MAFQNMSQLKISIKAHAIIIDIQINNLLTFLINSFCCGFDVINQYVSDKKIIQITSGKKFNSI
jgi:hypothetical protein